MSSNSQTWETIIDHPNYEINNETYEVRKIGTTRILKQTLRKRGDYLAYKLNGHNVYVHVIIAKQFIPNPNNYPVVDHRNKIKLDNRIENLRWVPRNVNASNRIDFEFLNEEDSKAVFNLGISFNRYDGHCFDPIYYLIDNFYIYDPWNGVRQLRMNDGDFVNVRNDNGKYVRIYLDKFKKIYEKDLKKRGYI